MMQIVERTIEDLLYAEYNPRQLTETQFKHLSDSIKRFGFIDPVIVNCNKDRKNIIIGGHQRVKVASAMGIKRIPTVELDLTYDKEKELNIRLNKNTGGWDYDILANMFDMNDLVGWGFNEKSLLGLFDDIDYSILEDDDIDSNMEGFERETRKAIQIEFHLEDYELAASLYKKMRDKYDYVGLELIKFFKSKLKGK